MRMLAGIFLGALLWSRGVLVQDDGHSMAPTTIAEAKLKRSFVLTMKDVVINKDTEYGIVEALATIDNGDFGTRTIRFETGQLARQADGSVTAYLDEDTMLLSTTTASNQPREGFDFFPLTVDVEYLDRSSGVKAAHPQRLFWLLG